MTDPETKLVQNAEKVMDSYNKIASDDKLRYTVDVKVVNNLQSLKDKLNKGYALKDTKVDTDTIKNEPTSKIAITDVIELDLGSDNLFMSGGFTLSKSGEDTIKASIEAIKNNGGKIESVSIESSTDAEEIARFKTKDDPTGNIKLADLRTQSVINLLNTIGIDSNITHREIPNNGSLEVSSKDFIKVAGNPTTLNKLREKTSDFRYIKISIVATFETPLSEDDKPDEIIKNYRFELVKIIESTGKTQNIKTKTNFKHKKFTCKKVKYKDLVDTVCSTF